MQEQDLQADVTGGREKGRELTEDVKDGGPAAVESVLAEEAGQRLRQHRPEVLPCGKHQHRA